MISVNRQFHDGMPAWVRLDDRVCSGWFNVDQSFHQEGVFVPLLFNIFFAAVINVVYTRWRVGKYIMDALVHLRKKWGRGSTGKQLPENQSWRRRFGACFRLTMPGLPRIPPSS